MQIEEISWGGREYNTVNLGHHFVWIELDLDIYLHNP